VDACPGRLNRLSFKINETGLYYGQCSELCGSNHAFMPIVVEALSNVDFCRFFDPTPPEIKCS